MKKLISILSIAFSSFAYGQQHQQAVQDKNQLVAISIQGEVQLRPGAGSL